MINKAFLQALLNALPKAQWVQPQLGASYVCDTNGELIGHFDYNSPGEFFLNADYEHCDIASERLKEHSIKTKPKKYIKGEHHE